MLLGALIASNESIQSTHARENQLFILIEKLIID